MEETEHIENLLSQFVSQLNDDHEDLERVRHKSESDTVKLKSKTKEIESTAASLRDAADNVSHENICSLLVALEKMTDEVKGMNQLHYTIMRLQQHISQSVSADNQLFASRNKIMVDLRKKVESMEDQRIAEFEKKKAEDEDMENNIIKRKKSCKEAENGLLVVQITNGQRQTITQELSNKLAVLHSQKQFRLNNISASKKNMSDAWIAATKQEENIDRVLADQIAAFNKISQTYSYMEAFQSDVIKFRTRLADLELMNEKGCSDVITLEETANQFTGQVEGMSLANDTRLLMFFEQKDGLLAHYGKLQNLTADTDNESMVTGEDTLKAQAESENLDVKITMIEKEFDIWKKSEMGKDDEEDDDEEVELDNEIAERRAKLEYLASQLGDKNESVVSSQTGIDHLVDRIERTVEPVNNQPSTSEKVSSSQEKSSQSTRKALRPSQPVPYDDTEDAFEIICDMRDEPAPLPAHQQILPVPLVRSSKRSTKRQKCQKQ